MFIHSVNVKYMFEKQRGHTKFCTNCIKDVFGDNVVGTCHQCDSRPLPLARWEAPMQTPPSPKPSSVSAEIWPVSFAASVSSPSRIWPAAASPGGAAATV